MQPVNFPQQNFTFTKPEGWTDEQCGSLSVWRGDVNIGTEQTPQPMPQIISAWKPTPAELEEINRTGIVWLYITGNGMPPVLVSGHCPFKEE